MPEIGYNYQVVRPQYKADIQNTELIAHVMMQKQQQYDQTYEDIKGLQRQSLGIRFINKKSQEKIDMFNENISRQFSTDEFGDLSESKVADRFYQMFDKIGQDKVLINNYKKDSSYQEMIRSVELKKSAKDPAKAGFGNINYSNFMRRVTDYSNLDLDSPENHNYQLRQYNDYIDMNKELADRIKTVPIKKFITQDMENGYIVSKIHEGRDPNDVRDMVKDYMETRGVTQMNELAEYTYNRAKDDPSFQSSIYNDHVDYNMRNQKEIGKRLSDNADELALTTDPKKIADLSQEKAILESNLAAVQLTLKSPTEYFNRDKDEVINDMAGILTYDSVIGNTSQYGGYAISKKIEPDSTFLQLQRMKQSGEQFNEQMKLNYAKYNLDVLKTNASIESDKLAAEENTAKSGNSATKAAAISAGYSYISASDPTHIDFVSTIEAADATLTKLYTQQTNFLSTGLTHGDLKVNNGEDVGLKLLIKPDVLDGNQYYKDSPYLRAWKVAFNDLHKTHPQFIDYLEKPPTTNEQWDKLKEANAVINAKVTQMMTRPANREEAQFANHLQDINANKQSLEDFMKDAASSGDPAKYVRDKQNIKIYANAVYDFEVPKDSDPKIKRASAALQQTFRPSFENNLDIPYGVYTEGSKNLNPTEWNNIYNDKARARTVPYDEVRKVETGPDGTIRVFFNENAFQQYVVKDEDGNAIVDNKRAGVLSGSDAYYSVRNDKGSYDKVTRDQIQAIGYLEYKDQSFSKLNWSNQMGITVGPKPQTRWDVTSDGQSIAFKSRRSTLNNQIEISVADGPYLNMGTSDLSAANETMRKIIATKTLNEITNK